MVKNILFDVDNTLIDSSSSNAIFYKNALEKIGKDTDKYLDVYNAIDFYEDTLDEKNNLYVKEDMLKLINQKLNENYPVQLIDEINDAIAKYWISKVLVDRETIEYLHSKYNLYIFSNWFYDAVYNRLKNIDYLKYFKDIFTSDKFGSKPYKNAFENVLKAMNALPDECVMIGDTIITDIVGARNIGMNAIWVNLNNKPTINMDGVKMITDFSKLNKIL